MKKRIRETLAAPYIGVSVYTLQKWRATGRGPPYYKAGRCVLYGVDDLDAYLEANKFNNTSEYK